MSPDAERVRSRDVSRLKLILFEFVDREGKLQDQILLESSS
jgi:hypothetical protein